MSKKQNFKVLSNKKCVVCKRRLKKNLVDKNPNAKMCYKHYQMIICENPLYPLDYAARKYLKNEPLNHK